MISLHKTKPKLWITVLVAFCSAQYSLTCSSLGNFEGTDSSQPLPIQTTKALQSTLGRNVMVDYFETGSTGNLVTSCIELTCHQFNHGQCRWRADEDADLEWFRGSGSPDAKRWKLATSSTDKPDSGYLVAASSRTDPLARAVLLSDPVKCQAGLGELRLQFWGSPSVTLIACWHYVGSLELRGCQKMFRDKESLRRIFFSEAIDKPFELVVYANNFVYRQGGFAVVDEISYCADFNCIQCESGSSPAPATSPAPSITPATSPSRMVSEGTPLPKRPDPNPAELSGAILRRTMQRACLSISCPLTDDFCSYQSDSTTARKWKTAGAPVGNGNTGIQSSPAGVSDFAVAQFSDVNDSDFSPSNQMLLTSEDLDLPETALLSFQRYQATAGSQLRVCILDDKTPSDCVWVSPPLSQGTQDNVQLNKQWRQETVRLPKGSYKVTFVAMYDNSQVYNTGYIGLSDIFLTDNRGNALC